MREWGSRERDAGALFSADAGALFSESRLASANPAGVGYPKAKHPRRPAHARPRALSARGCKTAPPPTAVGAGDVLRGLLGMFDQAAGWVHAAGIEGLGWGGGGG